MADSSSAAPSGPIITLVGGEVRGPNGQTGTVIGGFADFRYDKTPTMGQPERVTAVVVQPNIEEGTSGAPAIAEGPTSPSPAPALSDVDPE